VEYDKQLEEQVKKLWTELIELSEKRNYKIEYFGKSMIYNGARTMIIYAYLLNNEYWAELMETIERNNLRVEHWFIEAKKDEIKIYLWLLLKEAKYSSV
jgi:hypothetical protein